MRGRCGNAQETDHFFRIFSNDAGSDTVVLAFPASPGPELPVCAGLPCARVGHRFLLHLDCVQGKGAVQGGGR